jgi:hypothetical protein
MSSRQVDTGENLFGSKYLMSCLDYNFVIPACPESILKRDSRQAGVTDKHIVLNRTFILQWAIICHPELVSGSCQTLLTAWTKEIPKRVRHDS